VLHFESGILNWRGSMHAQGAQREMMLNSEEQAGESYLRYNTKSLLT